VEKQVKNTDRIAILQHDLRSGGTERMMLNLAGEWCRNEIHVDLVLVRREGAYLPLIPPDVRVVDLGARRTFTSVFPLVRYLRKERPRAILSGLVHVNIVAIAAVSLAPQTRLVISERNTPSHDMGDHEPAAKLGYRLAPYLYPLADEIVAVSAGVADDLSAFARLSRERIETVANPVITDQTLALARGDFPHRWFGVGAPPVVLAVGRLAPAKDYPTLLHAFAKLRAARDCRLLILGDGNLLPELTVLARRLKIASDVEFHGFVINPYAAMSKAAVLVLSSQWEGSPNVLTEAMACGLPVVSTDCPSGPREILDNGRYGPLVPIGNAEALASAMARMLDEPTPRPLLDEGCRPYHAALSAARYLEIMLRDTIGEGCHFRAT
jgi:glycosyltransferase involved in cell wall biosynthesis